MRFALMIEPQQGLAYLEQLAIARRAETAGFEAIYRSDHYTSFPGDSDRSTTDAWAVLAGLARETSSIRLGVLVSPVTFRSPANLAKLAVTVDEMSGGRLDVGVGAGWNEVEHRRHGFPFPAIEERADRLEETLQVLRGLWQGPDGWSFAGRHVSIDDALFRPRPVQRPAPPLILGGGSPRSMRLAVAYADEYNVAGSPPDTVVDTFEHLDGMCRAAGRDPASLVHSVMAGVLVGRDAGELRRRTADLRVMVGEANDGEAWVASRRPRWVMGTPEEALAIARRYAAAGTERLVLQDLVPRDLEMIDLLAEILIGKV